MRSRGCGFGVQKGRFTPYEARFYAAELVDVLEFIHGHGIVHRDLRVTTHSLSSSSTRPLLEQFYFEHMPS